MALQHRKFKLSPTRQKYVKKRDVSLQGEPIRANPRTVDRYADEVAKMITKMHMDVSSQIENLFDSATAKNSIQVTEEVASLEEVGLDGIAMDASIASMARILTNKLISKWTKRFNTFSYDWTKSMMGHVETQSAKDLGQSMSKLSGGLTIKTDQISDRTRDKILASADQSTSLIKTMGPNYTTEIKEAVSRAILDDSSSFTQLKESIHSMLNEKHKKYKNKAFNVASDQMRKAYTNVTTSRMRDIGVDTYKWKWAGGSQNPRSYHRDVLNGNTYSLSDPPVIDLKTGVKGKPGDLIFCHCYMIPVVSFDNKAG